MNINIKIIFKKKSPCESDKEKNKLFKTIFFVAKKYFSFCKLL